jgi:hypothetical protein
MLYEVFDNLSKGCAEKWWQSLLLHPQFSVIILNHNGVDTSVAFQNASSGGGYCTPQKKEINAHGWLKRTFACVLL